ncbi:MAG TPA: hypothetical protein VMU83_15325 [Hanamia sp.]|nr:hypothetical protein [Hanamia sp.]
MAKNSFWNTPFGNFINNLSSGLISGVVVVIIAAILTIHFLPQLIASITPLPPQKPSVIISQMNNGNETVFSIENNGDTPISYLSLKIGAPNLRTVKIDNRSSVNFRIFNGKFFDSVSVEASDILPYDTGLIDVYSYSNTNATLLNVSTDAGSLIFYLADERTGLPFGCKKLTCNGGNCNFLNITILFKNITGWPNAFRCPTNAPNLSGYYLTWNYIKENYIVSNT